MARGGGKAPRTITWVICLVLYIVAVLSHFGYIHVGRDIAQWSWIVGYALLLLAVRIRNL
jgi:small-conductance mechanosensitive channel